MAHNGGKWQLNLNYPWGCDDFPFANLIKQQGSIPSGDWTYCKPDTLSAQGYALPGQIAQFGGTIPSQAMLPGNYRLRWRGTAGLSILAEGYSVVSGSLTGTDGEAVLSLPDTSIWIGYAGHATDPLYDLSLVHEDHVASYDAGDIWNPRFIERLMECRPGILRFLNWTNPNNAYGRWEHRKPLDYSIWGADEYRASLYVTTTNVGNAFTTSGSGGTLAHGELAIVLLSASVVEPYDATLNWKGTGARPLFALSGLPLNTFFGAPAGGYFFACVYDSVLDAWLLDGAGALSSSMKNAVPIEVCIDLCNRIGAHCWIPIPFLASDPLTDYTAGLTTLARDTLLPGLKFFTEAGNEVWNTAAPFPGTWWAEYRGMKIWGIPHDAIHTATYAFYNKMTANVGHAVSDVYGGDRARFAIVSAVEGHPLVTDSVDASYARNLEKYNWRLKGTHYHADSGEYAASWVTHICTNNYWGAGYEGTTEETALAAEYATAVEPRKSEILNEYLLGPDDGGGVYRQYSGLAPYANSSFCALAWVKTHCYDVWVHIAEENGHAFIAYEGGMGAIPIPLSLDAKNFGTAMRDLTRFDLQNFVDAGGEFPSIYLLSSPNWQWSILSPSIYAPDSPNYLGVIDFNEYQAPPPTPTPDHGAFVDLDAYVTLVVDTTAKMTGVIE